MIGFLKGLLGTDHSNEEVVHTSHGPVSQPMAPPPNGYPTWNNSDEEKLRELQIEHAGTIKQAKLAEFIKIKANVREHIIDSIQFFESVKKINCTGVASPPQLRDMLHKKDMYHSTMTRYNNRCFSPPEYDYYANGSIFKLHATNYSCIELENSFCGLTLEDLLKAHTEQTVDEEVLGHKL